MSSPTLLGNGTVVVDFDESNQAAPRVVDDGAVVWENDRILAVGPKRVLADQYRQARFVDAHGGVIMPGLVNLHHHFYGALARGIRMDAPIRTFVEVLDRLWWRLDRALDHAAIRVSAELSLLDCLRWGCTTVFDHHASPSCIDGSLDVIAEAVRNSGLSAVLSYEVTDRNGSEQALAGIEENVRFMSERKNDRRIQGLMGLHASFTLKDETLERAAGLQPPAAGCHIHVAEDPIDTEASVAAFGIGPLQRLDRFGLLGQATLIAHGIHLRRADYEQIGHHGAALLHNPESNANNGVGHLDCVGAAKYGCLVGLGTDGMSSAVLRALRMAFLIHRSRTGDPGAGFAVLPQLLANNVAVARRVFDEPLLGALVPGAPADLISIDVPPPTPIGTDNLFGHLVYGMSEAPVRHTIARGSLVLEDFRPRTLDPVDVAARARERAPCVWKRISEMSYGTDFLGA